MCQQNETWCVNMGGRGRVQRVFRAALWPRTVNYPPPPQGPRLELREGASVIGDRPAGDRWRKPRRAEKLLQMPLTVAIISNYGNSCRLIWWQMQQHAPPPLCNMTNTPRNCRMCPPLSRSRPGCRTPPRWSPAPAAAGAGAPRLDCSNIAKQPLLIWSPGTGPAG